MCEEWTVMCEEWRLLDEDLRGSEADGLLDEDGLLLENGRT